MKNLSFISIALMVLLLCSCKGKSIRERATERCMAEIDSIMKSKNLGYEVTDTTTDFCNDSLCILRCQVKSKDNQLDNVRLEFIFFDNKKEDIEESKLSVLGEALYESSVRDIRDQAALLVDEDDYKKENNLTDDEYEAKSMCTAARGKMGFFGSKKRKRSLQ